MNVWICLSSFLFFFSHLHIRTISSVLLILNQNVTQDSGNYAKGTYLQLIVLNLNFFFQFTGLKLLSPSQRSPRVKTTQNSGGPCKYTFKVIRQLTNITRRPPTPPKLVNFIGLKLTSCVQRVATRCNFLAVY